MQNALMQKGFKLQLDVPICSALIWKKNTNKNNMKKMCRNNRWLDFGMLKQWLNQREYICFFSDQSLRYACFISAFNYMGSCCVSMFALVSSLKISHLMLSQRIRSANVYLKRNLLNKLAVKIDSWPSFRGQICRRFLYLTRWGGSKIISSKCCLIMV